MFDTKAVVQSKNGVNPASAAPADSVSLDAVPDPEVIPRARRRRLTNNYKLRILQQANEW